MEVGINVDHSGGSDADQNTESSNNYPQYVVSTHDRVM
ncbi:hypothetical protein L917_07974, partial [Phytophthora nicotianae]